MNLGPPSWRGFSVLTTLLLIDVLDLIDRQVRFILISSIKVRIPIGIMVGLPGLGGDLHDMPGWRAALLFVCAPRFVVELLSLRVFPRAPRFSVARSTAFRLR
jgi:hypothetical protein